MPIYEPRQVEYAIIYGNISIVLDGGGALPAYWAHPDLGGTFPAIALIHDWWGITALERRLAHLLAQSGYYVIVPDLFNGQVATTPEEALALVRALGEQGYGYVNTALQTIENHVRSNRSTGVIGLGMGGSLAFEAAIKRSDLEAAVALYGFPQRYLGRFSALQAPLLAMFGSKDPYVRPKAIARLRRELAAAAVEHDLVVLEGASRNFFDEAHSASAGAIAWQKTTEFMARLLHGPSTPPAPTLMTL